MIRAIRVLPHGDWEKTTLLTDTVVLDYDQRHRRRMAMKGKRGFEFLLDLSHAVAKLRIRRDYVIEAMVTGLGGTVTVTEAAFDPKVGAYAEHGHVHAGDGRDSGALEHDDHLDDEGPSAA